ncbi:hypothetical protein GN155_011565 [Alcanivorax sp. ZXX171]|nr:hypothetical protein [Alcanivorax sp. ZXX171]
MKRKILLSSLLGAVAWSVSGAAAASWDSGACPQPHTGPAPCFETEINGNTYHFNGSGGHADEWHGLPAAEGGGDFQFSSEYVDIRCSLASPSCAFNASGQVKKCKDSSGAWRIGVRVNSINLSPGDFVCNFATASGFPWYSKDRTISNQCPFEDDCDSFLPYEPGASSYVGNFGTATISVTLIGILVEDEYLNGMVFTPGVGATLDFNDKSFMSCDAGEESCSVDGSLTLDNATSFDIY